MIALVIVLIGLVVIEEVVVMIKQGHVKSKLLVIYDL
jgi:hypothetical protein